ncbi:MAG: hypothetical protein U9P07_04325 [Pseudomonadota bacterium]|nr:hypothetical protein [Pseudomonadota bacterium]
METSVIIVVATTSQSLATFIKQELSETDVTVQLLTDPELFFKRLKSIKPELILLDANYPTGEKSASLTKRLQDDLTWQDTPLIVIKTFFEPFDESFPEINTENILTQPFTRADLLAILQRVAPQAINNHGQNQDMDMSKTNETLQEPEVANSQEGTIIELTDMVEEGIPLDQLNLTDNLDSPPPETVTTQGAEMPEDKELEEDIAFPSDAAIDELVFAAGDETKMATDLSVSDESPTADQTEKGPIKETIEKTLDAESETTAAPEEFPPERPEDYLTPHDPQQGNKSFTGTPESESTPLATESETARTSVFTEPQTVDFSKQIEGLTQEWSKKMLVSTYASMDKLIQALGDMAPTIVEQVAREIIPPLAEKIIKTEIKRLEDKIEDDHK